MSTIVKVAFGVVLGFFLIVAVWLIGWGVVMERLEAQRRAVPAPTGLTVLLHEVERDRHSTYIAGSAQNNSGGDLSFALVRFAVTDEGGAQMGTATDSTTALSAGALWQFRARVAFRPLAGGVEGELRYELSEVEAW